MYPSRFLCVHHREIKGMNMYFLYKWIFERRFSLSFEASHHVCVGICVKCKCSSHSYTHMCDNMSTMTKWSSVAFDDETINIYTCIMKIMERYVREERESK